MLVSTNVLTPFSYAQVETPENNELTIETEVENIWESIGTPDYLEEFPENASNDLWELEHENQNNETPDVLLDSQEDINTPTTDDTEENEWDKKVHPTEEIPEWWNLEEWNIWEEKENEDAETGDLLLKSLIDTELYAVDNPIECSSWYVLNADWTWCELIKVTFDANGWSFSGGEETKTVDTIVNEVPPVRYSHTANINDDWVATSVYANNLSKNDVVTIPWATSLDIEVRFATESASYDWLAIYPAGIDPTPSNYSSASISNWKLGWHGSYSNYTKPKDTDTTYHRNFTANGDTAQFYFKSDSGGAYYGYYAIVNWINASNSYRCEYDITVPTREWYIFQWWYIDEEFTQKFDLFQCLSTDMRAYAKWYKIQGKDIVLEVTATEANQTLKINKYFKNAYTVYRWDGESENLTADTTHEYTTAWTYTVILSTTANRWTFQDVGKPLVPKAGTTVTDVKVVLIPSLADWFGANATNPWDYFFANFNWYDSSRDSPIPWAITSLPEWSFDTSDINVAGNRFFSDFNARWALENLPEWSFDISNITSVWSSFFYSFNNNWKLTRLPRYSFRLSTWLTTAWSRFFHSFNKEWNLEQLPDESFNISSITKEGAGFFYEFNEGWKLIRLPEWSFDTSNITSAHLWFFNRFNANWNLESLPEWSFDISNISEQKFGVEAVGFFEGFNAWWALKSLPKNSFRLSPLLTGVYNEFFGDFNARWALEHLPEWSFDISNITSSYSNFFWYFNYSWALKNLPEWSFILSTWLTNVGYGFFYAFNDNWALESLPEGSFNISNITSEWGSFFARFNSYWKLKELPKYSFWLSKWMTAAWSEFFAAFNAGWALESLPEWSFDISNITSVKDGFFGRFNHSWDLTSLPEKSFNTSNITKIDYWGTYCYFFNSFNEWWALESLPEWSFDISNITKTTRHEKFFDSFNKNWKLVNLPNSFKLNSAYANYWYENAFNSPNYTLNKSVSDLLSWIATPTYDRNTFSDNQPWRCGVDANWLVNNNGCSIIYDYNWWWEQAFQLYKADATWVNAWLKVKIPYKEKYIFDWWYTSKIWWKKIDYIKFPEMDGKTLYAHYTCDYWYTFWDDGETCELVYVKFNTNWGSFWEKSEKYIVKPEIIELQKKVKKYSYTPNIKEDWSQSWDYEDFLNLNDVVNIPKAEKLKITITRWWWFYDRTCMWEWNHPEYSAQENYLSSLTNQLRWWDHTSESNTKIYEISWDTVTFSFVNNYGSRFSKWDGYWYYAIIEWTWTFYEINYKKDIFNKIPYPTKNWYKFIWWYYNEEWVEKEFNSNDIRLDRIYNVYAKWEKLWSSGWWGWGSGWGSSSKTDTGSASSQTWNQINSNTGDTDSTWTNVKEPETNTGSNIQTWSQVDSSEQTTQNNESNAQDSTTLSQDNGKTYSTEFQEAYEFAKWNWITTMPTIQKANMEWKLTRIAMAKMLSQYAINVLWKTPDTSKTIKFRDVTSKKDADYDNWVTLAYQLWIMWQNMPWNNFRPNDEVTRAEFATALSRMAYNTSDWEYKSTSKYYTHHMEKLVNEWIITNDNPNMKELRWYVMIMLMRSAK